MGIDGIVTLWSAFVVPVTTTVHGITGFNNLLNSAEIVNVFLDNELHVNYLLQKEIKRL